MFREKTLQYIFFLSLSMAAIFLLANIYFVYHLFAGFLVHKCEETALRAAGSLRGFVVKEHGRLSGKPDFQRETRRLKNDLGVAKVTVFSHAGEILFSTEPEKGSGVSDGGYFRDLVASGRSYTIVLKNESSFREGEETKTEMVETTVPLMNGGSFAGAVKISYDITADKRMLRKTIIYASVIPVSFVAGFLVLVISLLVKTSRDIDGRRKVEDALRRHRNSMEDTVSERTSELRKANEDLEREIAERLHAEEALKRSESFLSTIFNSIHDPFCIFSREYRVVRANEGYARLKGRDTEDLLGRACYEALAGRAGVCENCVVEKTILSGEPCTKDKKLVLPGGSEMWLEIYTYPIFDGEGNISHVIEYTRDITERKLVEEEKRRLIAELEFRSRIDSLSGLLNRRALLERLEHEMERASRYRTKLSLIICDIDSFKGINDTYGHLAGDKALRRIAETIAGFLRKADVAGRYGGDEFIIILPETDAKGAGAFAERLRMGVEREKLEFRAGEIHKVSISLGVSTFNPRMTRLDDLIVPADTALYASKLEGRNRVTVYHTDPRKGDPGIQISIPFH